MLCPSCLHPLCLYPPVQWRLLGSWCLLATFRSNGGSGTFTLLALRVVTQLFKIHSLSRMEVEVRGVSVSDLQWPSGVNPLVKPTQRSVTNVQSKGKNILFYWVWESWLYTSLTKADILPLAAKRKKEKKQWKKQWLANFSLCWTLLFCSEIRCQQW